MDREGPDRIEGEPDASKSPDTSDRIAELTLALDELAREVERLGARIDGLEGTRSVRSRGGSARGRRRNSPSESVDVVMRPVPELAMAAVAERALRRAEPVEPVVRAEAGADGEHSARYRVEMRAGSDLVGEVGKTLPVSFQASEAESGVLFFDLKW